MVEDVVNIRDEEEEEEVEATPEWMGVLLKTKFWEQCKEHSDASRRVEVSLFCLRCYQVVCPRCTHDEPGHRLLKVRHYVYRSVVLIKDMQDLDVDVSRVQTYIINKQKGVHLRPMRRSENFKGHPRAPRCLTCCCWLRNPPNIFCSLSCKEDADVPHDDFSGPKADRKHRLIQVNPVESPTQHSPQPSNANVSPVTNHHHVPEVEDNYGEVETDVPESSSHQECPPSSPQYNVPSAPAANQHHLDNRPKRNRPRKQATPMHAPFFLICFPEEVNK